MKNLIIDLIFAAAAVLATINYMAGGFSFITSLLLIAVCCAGILINHSIDDH